MFSIVKFIALAALICVNAHAQQARNQKDPRIGYVFPAGAKAGSFLEVTVGGQYLEGVSAARVSGSGVEASVVKYTRPLSQKEFNELREKLMEAWMKTGESGGMHIDGLIKRGLLALLAKEIGISDQTIEALVDYRKKLSDPKRQLNPQLAESVRLKLLIAPDAPLGVRELRLVTPTGVSNPVRFCVGDLPETVRPEGDFKTVTPIEALPATLNGQLLPGCVDRYCFPTRKGQRIMVGAYVRGLIPYLADAVPGWFQAALTLRDAQGREVAHAGEFRFDPDPVLFCEIAADGAYTLEVKDALYRGREDFVYRITIGELPFVTSIFPLGAKEGDKAIIQVRGWNLPDEGVRVEKWAQPCGVQTLSFALGARQSNDLLFSVDRLTECLEKEPNNDAASAQPIAIPVIINGRVDLTDHGDVYRFEGRGGDQIVAEVYARRLGSPLDSMLILTDGSGKQLALNDDYIDKGEGLLTHHADSFLSALLPSSGTYFLRLADTQSKGGQDFAYRLRVSLRRPDFALRVAPSCINVRAGSVAIVSVCALRRDGFDGPIDLSLKDGPGGAELDGSRIPAGQEAIRMTLRVPPTCPLGSYTLALEGRAVIQAQTIERIALPADEMLQAFSYHHLVPSIEQTLTVVESARLSLPVRLAQSLPVKLRRGETSLVRFTTLAGQNLIDQLQLELNDPPPGITLESLDKSRAGVTLALKVEAAKVSQDLKGNLLLNILIERTPQPMPGKPALPKQRLMMGVLPAIPFEVTN